MLYPHKCAKTGGLFAPTRVYDNIGKREPYLEPRVAARARYLAELKEDIGGKQLAVYSG